MKEKIVMTTEELNICGLHVKEPPKDLTPYAHSTLLHMIMSAPQVWTNCFNIVEDVEKIEDLDWEFCPYCGKPLSNDLKYAPETLVDLMRNGVRSKGEIVYFFPKHKRPYKVMEVIDGTLVFNDYAEDESSGESFYILGEHKPSLIPSKPKIIPPKKPPIYNLNGDIVDE